MNSISPAKAVNNIQWNSDNNKWNVNLYSTFVAKQDRVATERHDLFQPAGYSVYDLFIDYKLAKKQKLRFGLFNLTNKKYWDWQQVRNFEENDAVLQALSKPSRNLSFSYSIEM